MADDPLDPARFLDPIETLVWSGRPDPKAPLPPMIRVLRIIGWMTAAIFALFGLIGWANRAELDGTGGTILGVFLVMSGAVALGFVIGAPFLFRAKQRNIRYGVSDRRALTVQGGSKGAVIRRPVTQKAQIVARKKHYTVYYAKAQMRNYTVQHGNMHRKTVVAVGFEGLDLAAATLAAAALDRAKGKDTGLPIESPLG